MQHDISKELGVAVRKRRKQLRLNQQTAGELAGCGRLFVSQLENGKQGVRLDKVLDLLHVLGLELHVASGSGRFVVEDDA